MKTANFTSHLQNSRDRGPTPPIGTPAWLVRVRSEASGSTQGLATFGAQVLVRSGLMCAGLRPVSRARGGTRPSAKGLNKVLRNLPKRCGALEDRLPATIAHCVGERVARRVEEANVLAGRPTTRDICSLLKSVVVDGALARRDVTSDAPTEAGITPLEVMSAVKAILQVRDGEVAFDAVNARCVIAVGIAYLGLLNMQRCSWCFRWAWPGQQACALHSLSAEVGGTPNERQARYEAGKRVCEHIGQSTYSQSPRFHRLSAREARWVVARVLFTVTLTRETEVCKKLLAAIRRSPLLSSAALRDEVDLSRFEGGELIEKVRTWLDPAELRPRVFLQELAAAERWYRAAETALPGTRGPARKTDGLHVSAHGTLAGRRRQLRWFPKPFRIGKSIRRSD